LEKKGIVPSEVFPGIELDIEKIFI
jgi:hypothetical protein